MKQATAKEILKRLGSVRLVAMEYKATLTVRDLRVIAAK
jgi:hypothetical protein